MSAVAGASRVVGGPRAPSVEANDRKIKDASRGRLAGVNVFHGARIAILVTYNAAAHPHHPSGSRELLHGPVNYAH